MFINKRLGLLAMTRRARFIQARHRQPAPGFLNVHPMRVMALHAIHFSLDDRMMLRKIELGVRLQMATETGARIFSRIDDESPAPASHSDMRAACDVAGSVSQ